MKSVLIISENKKNADTLRAACRQHNLLVEGYADVFAGIERMRECHFDVVVLDAESNCFSPVKAIRLIKRFDPDARIIVHTSRNSRQLEVSIRKEQIFYFHVNSFGVEEIILAVLAALGLSCARREVDDQRRILLVDDDTDFLALQSAVLERHGYHVVSASNLDAARELIASWHPHLICLDIRMPSQKEGLQFARQLRQDQETSMIPILFMRSDRSPSLPMSATVDNDLWIEKPFASDVFVSTIQNYLRESA
jgi:CheY-like chemotaxis protein